MFVHDIARRRRSLVHERHLLRPTDETVELPVNGRTKSGLGTPLTVVEASRPLNSRGKMSAGRCQLIRAHVLRPVGIPNEGRVPAGACSASTISVPSRAAAFWRSSRRNVGGNDRAE